MCSVPHSLSPLPASGPRLTPTQGQWRIHRCDRLACNTATFHTHPLGSASLPVKTRGSTRASPLPGVQEGTHEPPVRRQAFVTSTRSMLPAFSPNLGSSLPRFPPVLRHPLLISIFHVQRLAARLPCAPWLRAQPWEISYSSSVIGGSGSIRHCERLEETICPRGTTTSVGARQGARPQAGCRA